MLNKMLEAGYAIGMMIIIFGFLFLLVMAWVCYLSPYIARFTDNTKTVLLNSFRITFANIKETLMVLAMTVVQIFLTLISLPVGILFVFIC